MRSATCFSSGLSLECDSETGQDTGIASSAKTSTDVDSEAWRPIYMHGRPDAVRLSDEYLILGDAVVGGLLLCASESLDLLQHTGQEIGSQVYTSAAP